MSVDKEYIKENGDLLLMEKQSGLEKSGDSCTDNKTQNEESAKICGTPFLSYRLSKQILLFVTWISMGYGRGMIGPVLPDLKEKFDTDYEVLGRVTATSSIGFVGGCLVGGIAHEVLHRHTDVIMAASVIVGGVCSALVPWMPSTASLIALFIVGGFAGAVQNAGGNTMVLDVWQASSAPFVFMLHLGFGIGAFLGPLVTAPFLSALVGEVPCNSTHLGILSLLPSEPDDINTTSLPPCVNETSIPLYKPPKLEVPFALEGLFDVLLCILFVAFYMKGIPKGYPAREGTTDVKKLFNPGQCTQGQTGRGCVLLVLLFFFFCQAVGGELAFSQFVYTFAKESSLGFTTGQATRLTSLFFLCHLTGRGTGAILAKCIPLTIIILADILLLVLSAVVLAIWGSTNAMVLWACTGLIGFLCSFIYPAGTSWANLHMQVNSMVIMVTMFGGATGYVIYTYLGGYLIEYVSLDALLYLEATYAVLLLVNFIAMMLVGRKMVHSKNTEEDIVVNDDKHDTHAEVLLTSL